MKRILPHRSDLDVEMVKSRRSAAYVKAEVERKLRKGIKSRSPTIPCERLIRNNLMWCATHNQPLNTCTQKLDPGPHKVAMPWSFLDRQMIEPFGKAIGAKRRFDPEDLPE